jgi:hypothetical protein
MTTVSNKLAPAQVVAQLNDLANAHTDWENSTYKASNTELYALLDRCFTLMEQMKGTTKLIKELNALLVAKGIVFNDGTSLATKIARFVFNGNSKRITGYARVLRIAQQEKPANLSFAAFIQRNGGVEEVRKQKVAGVLTPAEQAKRNMETAETYFVSSEALVQDIASAAPELHPGSETGYQFAAALVRKNDDGTLSIVYGNNKSSVVKVLLAEAGKLDLPELDAARRAAEAQRDNALDDIAA